MEKKKSIVYKRLFFTYTLVILALIVIFDCYLITLIKKNTEENKFSVGENLAYDLSYGIEKIDSLNKTVVQNLYYEELITNDVINFLELEVIDYIKNSFDNDYSYNGIYYKGINGFCKDIFRISDSIENVSLLSYEKNEMRTFNRVMELDIKKIEDITNYKNMKNYSILCDKEKITIVNNIVDPTNLDDEKGKLIVTYNLSIIKSTMRKYEKEFEGLILDKKGSVIYDSTGEHEYEYFKDFEKIENMDEGKVENLSKGYKAFKLSSLDGINTVFKIKKQYLFEGLKSFQSTLIILNVIMFILSLAIIKVKLEKFSNRMNEIIVAMDNVKKGNLDVEIAVGTENDEISYIAENFNEMCSSLDNHIKKSYVAELNQKKAEMDALQNQINPHFLYNTLECIRMRAISNGDREIGKMLYDLSFLFRKQVKDKNIITVGDELKYCEKYIEIFKFRYSEKLDYKINCPEELKKNQIIKFVLQPLVENYFVHGIRLTDNDNFIEINVNKKDDNIEISIEDNGIGLTYEKIKQIETAMKSKVNDKKSIGIVNVQERIVAAYGEDYGLKFMRNNKGGAIVLLKIPYLEGEQI